MTISWFFIFIFLLIIIGEMYFLGKYISITQNIFSNKSSASFALGGITYFIITIITFFPFTWFNLSMGYFGVIVLIKDFFTVVFLVVRRDIFSKLIINYKNFIGTIVSAILIPIFYNYVISPNNQMHGIEQKYDQQVWKHFLDSLKFLSRSSETDTYLFLIGPISGAMTFSCVSSIYHEFSKKNGWPQLLIVIFLTIGFSSMFNLGINIEGSLFIGLILFLFYAAYNLVIMSRRRYGLLYGLIIFVIWTINADTFWFLGLSSFIVISTYVLLKKPRPIIFLLQLFAPILVLAAVQLVSVSTILAVFVTTAAISFYFSIFIIVRIKWIETKFIKWKFNFKYDYLIYLGFILLIIIIINVATQKKPELTILWKGNQIMGGWGINYLKQFFNIEYYVLFILISIYSIYNVAFKRRFTKVKLFVLMAFLSFVILFNPLVQNIFIQNGSEKAYSTIKIFAVAPMLIVAIAKIDIKKTKQVLKTWKNIKPRVITITKNRA